MYEDIAGGFEEEYGFNFKDAMIMGADEEDIDLEELLADDEYSGLFKKLRKNIKMKRLDNQKRRLKIIAEKWESLNDAGDARADKLAGNMAKLIDKIQKRQPDWEPSSKILSVLSHYKEPEEPEEPEDPEEPEEEEPVDEEVGGYYGGLMDAAAQEALRDIRMGRVEPDQYGSLFSVIGKGLGAVLGGTAKAAGELAGHTVGGAAKGVAGGAKGIAEGVTLSPKEKARAQKKKGKAEAKKIKGKIKLEGAKMSRKEKKANLQSRLDAIRSERSELEDQIKEMQDDKEIPGGNDSAKTIFGAFSEAFEE